MLDRILDPGLETAPLLVLAYVEKILQQDDAAVRPISRSNGGRELQEPLVLLVAAEAHHPLDARPIVPGAIEQDDLAGGREMSHVALDIHLALLAARRRRQCHVLEHARAATLHDPGDHPALAGGVAALEHDDDAGALGYRPGLEPGQLDLELSQFLFELLTLDLWKACI